jgi:heparosan-N-sulfate-glucuronate 5-epimerase
VTTRRLGEALKARGAPRRTPELPIGRNVRTDAIGGYYIDFRSKLEAPEWPPPWFPWPGFHRFMGVSQWGLGAFERYRDGEGEQWLAAAAAAAEHIRREQRPDGRGEGGWFEPEGHPHTFHTDAPWLSAMAQGQCASLLVRVGIETSEPRLLETAAKGLQPMLLSTAEGGVRARLDGGIFLEEYPTDPPSFVLNGAIFALWGAYDVWRGAGDDAAHTLFTEAAETLAGNLQRWDTGFWSRYDLFPLHPIVNTASPFYHALHINQLRALDLIWPSSAVASTAARFETYAASPRKRGRALVQKVAFRILVRKPRVRVRHS